MDWDTGSDARAASLALREAMTRAARAQYRLHPVEDAALVAGWRDVYGAATHPLGWPLLIVRVEARKPVDGSAPLTLRRDIWYAHSAVDRAASGSRLWLLAAALDHAVERVMRHDTPGEALLIERRGRLVVERPPSAGAGWEAWSDTAARRVVQARMVAERAVGHVGHAGEQAAAWLTATLPMPTIKAAAMKAPVAPPPTSMAPTGATPPNARHVAYITHAERARAVQRATGAIAASVAAPMAPLAWPNVADHMRDLPPLPGPFPSTRLTLLALLAWAMMVCAVAATRVATLATRALPPRYATPRHDVHNPRRNARSA